MTKNVSSVKTRVQLIANEIQKLRAEIIANDKYTEIYTDWLLVIQKMLDNYDLTEYFPESNDIMLKVMAIVNDIYKEPQDE